MSLSNPQQSSPQGSTPNSSKQDELREKLAAIEHERWADWQAWCHKILRENCPSPELEKVLKRWDVQIETPYDDLTVMEKDSDREQVDRYWHLIEEYAATLAEAARKDAVYSMHDSIMRHELIWPSQQYRQDVAFLNGTVHKWIDKLIEGSDLVSTSLNANLDSSNPPSLAHQKESE